MLVWQYCPRFEGEQLLPQNAVALILLNQSEWHPSIFSETNNKMLCKSEQRKIGAATQLASELDHIKVHGGLLFGCFTDAHP
jgi:hypothetical protein